LKNEHATFADYRDWKKPYVRVFYSLNLDLSLSLFAPPHRLSVADRHASSGDRI
jgi:hypothetical protein